MNDIARVLGGVHAGFSGNLPVWRQQRAEEEQRNQEAEMNRMKTVFTDSLSALNFANQGRWDLVAGLGQSRLEMAQNFPGVDFSDTARLTQAANLAAQGDVNAQQSLMNELTRNVEIGRGLGVLEQAPQDKLLKTEDGVAVYQRPDGSVYTDAIEGYGETLGIAGHSANTDELPGGMGFMGYDNQGNVHVVTNENKKLAGQAAADYVDAAYEKEQARMLEQADKEAFNADRRTFVKEEGVMRNIINKAINDDARLNRQIARVKELLSDGAGGWKQVFSVLPESEEKELLGLMTAISSFAALGKMAELKSLSSTGATGFGALNEKELELLINNLGSIDSYQKPEALIRTLTEIEQYSNDLIATAVEGYQSAVDLYGTSKPAITFTRKNLFDPTDTGLTPEESAELKALREKHGL